MKLDGFSTYYEGLNKSFDPTYGSARQYGLN